MSQFDRYTNPEYIEALRVFLKRGKRDFLQEEGFFISDELYAAQYAALPVEEQRKQFAALKLDRVGRLSKYPEHAIARVEQQANEKAALAESPQASLGERYRIARDYLGLGDVDVAAKMGVSRELVRRWGENISKPSNPEELSNYLQVPLAWLIEGGESHLPANSHIGVRVGDEQKLYKEELYALTLGVVGDLPEEADEAYGLAYIEWAVHNQPNLSRLARRAGGRWQVLNGILLFAPWVPIPPHGLSRRYWCDEVENIVQEELAKPQSVFRAWANVRDRCVAKGYSAEEFPKRISLHKRVEAERKRAESFGVDLNDVIADAVRKYTQ